MGESARRTTCRKSQGSIAANPLFIAEGLERRLLLSSAIAAFGLQQTFATGSQPRSLAIADVNLDGKPDLLVANAVSNTVSVLLGNGNGTFQPQVTFAAGAGPFAIAVADVNQDGKPDLIVADNGANAVSVLLGNGNGTFQAPISFATGSAPRAVAVADINGDGKPDIVAANYSSNSVSILLGNGNGTFQVQQTYATGTQPRSIAIADVNTDGKPDLITANHGSNSVSVLLNSGAGTFPTQTTYATGTSPFSVATADVNQDGKPDVLVANNGSNSVSVLLNTGTGSFSAQQTFAAGAGPIALAASDINGDGKEDIVVANYNANSAGVLLGNGDGSFQAQKTFAVGAGPRSVAVADINADTREDLVAANTGANSASVLIGDLPPTVVSINGAGPSQTTGGPTVSYAVTFNEPVIGVAATDFSVAVTGSVTSSAQVVVGGSGAAYNVTINGISGSGTLQLDLVNNGAIVDAAGNPLQPGNTSVFPGETYNVVPPAPSTYVVRSIGLFGVNQAGVNPQGTLVIDSAGNLFGAAPTGGAYGDGTIFEIAHGSSAITTLASFNGTDGARPYAGLAIDGNGNLFGTTTLGVGTVFELAHNSSTITTLTSFSADDTNAFSAQGTQEQLTFDGQGNLYGATFGGGGAGSVFEIPNGTTTLSTVALFASNISSHPANPTGALVIDSSGDIYGTTEYGGTNNDGTVFFIPHGTSTVQTIASFNGTNGVNPIGGLVRDSSGDLFGTTEFGPTFGYGTVFEIANGTSTITTLASLTENYAHPTAPLLIDSGGNLYGTCSGGAVYELGPTGSGTGRIFELAHGSSVPVSLGSFNGANGSAPLGGLVFDASGNLYGVATQAGTFNQGAVYEIPSGATTANGVAYFDPTNGYGPGPIVADSAGDLFGVTANGGTRNQGTVFEVPHGTTTLTTLASFNGANGSGPNDLVIDGSGNLFGIANEGSTIYGTVFEIPAHTSTIVTIADFNGADGQVPQGLAIDPAGNLFGVTNDGGANNDGAIFEVAHGSSTISLLTSFDATNPHPNPGIVLDDNDDVFGTINYVGGSANQSDIFELAFGNSTATVLASLSTTPTEGGLAIDKAGNLYGTTFGGGADNHGSVFELPKNSSAVATLASFDGVDGGNPVGPLLIDPAGDLFGTAWGGEPFAAGVVFEVAHGNSTIITVASFNGADGAQPNNLIADSAGGFYGTSNALFKLSPVPVADTIAAAPGGDTISLSEDSDSLHIDWTANGSSGVLPIDDPNGLTINGNGGNDTITLDYTNGNPLPNILQLNGRFAITGLQGANPLVGKTLEMGKSTVYISYSAADPIAAIQSSLQNGYNGGAWNGTPNAITGSITSTAAQANQGYMIGYADSADSVVTGQPANTIELKYTLGGDLNLAGTVNFADFAKVVADYGKPALWDGGAITYGSTVSFADFALTVANYGKQAAATTGLASFDAAGTAQATATASATTTPAPTSKPVVASIAPTPAAVRMYVPRSRVARRHR